MQKLTCAKRHENAAKNSFCFFTFNPPYTFVSKNKIALFAALSCFLADVNFFHYAKFMHFDALKHFSLLNLNWNISYFIFLHKCICRVKCKKNEKLFLQRFHAFWSMLIFALC